MKRLTRFDVAEYRGTYMVVVESEYLPADPAVVVIPLLQTYPSVEWLNPEIMLQDGGYNLATRLISAVKRSALKRIGNVANQSDAIVRAIDVLLGGI